MQEKFDSEEKLFNLIDTVKQSRGQTSQSEKPADKGTSSEGSLPKSSRAGSRETPHRCGEDGRKAAQEQTVSDINSEIQ